MLMLACVLTDTYCTICNHDAFNEYILICLGSFVIIVTVVISQWKLLLLQAYLCIIYVHVVDILKAGTDRTKLLWLDILRMLDAVKGDMIQ